MTLIEKDIAARSYDVDAIRRDFPALSLQVHGKPLVYLDNAASAQKPKAMDNWVDPRRSLKSRKSLFRAQYNALGNRNLPAIERIATFKYQRGLAFKRQHPFLDILLSDITESGEVLDVSQLI